MRQGQQTEDHGDCYSGSEAWIEIVVRIAGIHRYIAIFAWYGGRACGSRIGICR
jgi:hypothetical protein